MDLRQLNALVAVADHRSFSAAARALHTVQSNVSTHIARLERELGATLVDRRSGELTLEGASVVSRARRIQSELQSIDGDVAAMRDEVRGAVRVGMIGTTARWLVPRVLDSLEAAHPAVQIIIVDATTTSLLPQVADGLLELALVQLPVEHPDIETEPAFEEDAIVLVPTEHPLAEHDEIDLAELARHRILASPAGISFRSMLDEICRREGIELDIRAEIDGMRLLASLAVSGYAPAVVPSTAAPRWLRGDFKRVLLKAPARRSVGLIRSRRTTLSAPARAARDAIRTALVETAGDQHGVTLTLED